MAISLGLGSGARRQYANPVSFGAGGSSPISPTSLGYLYDIRRGQSVLTTDRDGATPVNWDDPSTQVCGYISDLSGNGRHLIAPSDGERPSFSITGANSRPAVGQFATGTGKGIGSIPGSSSGGKAYIGSTINWSNDGWYVFAVGYVMTPDSQKAEFTMSVDGGSGNSELNCSHVTGSGTLDFYNASNAVTAISSGGNLNTVCEQPFVFAWRYTSSGMAGWVNGYSATFNTPNYNSSAVISAWGMGTRIAAGALYTYTNIRWYCQFLSVIRATAIDNARAVEISQELKELFNVQ